MLSDLEFHATIPASDLMRAKQFYTEKLGLRAPEETPGGLVFQCKGSWFLLYPSGGAGTAKNTLGGWSTDNIEREVSDLRSRGVVFEDYDLPGLKTVNGIATMGPNRAAWFKDSEGNILGIVQMESTGR